uniref:hypothetical protein n=1 Tax=Microtetraspora malaysiensis TaxID=161358 RepID=UPI003F491534
MVTLLRASWPILPPDRFGHAEAVAQIRAYLAGEIAPPDSSPATPAELWSVEAGRVRTALRRVRQGAVSAAAEHPDDARKLAAELRELADEVEQGLQ